MTLGIELEREEDGRPRRGIEAAVPIDQSRQLERMKRPDLKELLLAADARTDTLTPSRTPDRHRAVPALDPFSEAGGGP